MPIVRRKKVLLVPPPSMAAAPLPSELVITPPLKSEDPDAEIDQLMDDGNGEKKPGGMFALPANQPVYFMRETGEIFTSYEAYTARLSFYNQRIFQCEVTGRSNMTFFGALKSERAEARTLAQRFPEQLKAPVLKSVQFQVVGRLDDLVGEVHERFKDRYYQGEKILVEQDGERFLARVASVFPPKKRNSPTPPEVHPLPPNIKSPPLDDPLAYFYSVQILDSSAKESVHASLDEKEKEGKRGRKEEGRERRRSARGRKGEGEEKEKGEEDEDEEGKTKGEGYSGSYLELRPDHMSRDRLQFSKSILRRYLASCLTRAAAVASPWVVRRALCKQFGIDEEMGEARREQVQEIRKGALGKRKKVKEPEPAPEEEVKEEEEGPKRKKARKSAKGGKAEEKRQAAERKAAAEAEAQRKREEEEVVAAAAAAAAAAALAAAAAKKKAIKYPTEDLDVRLTDRERKAGRRVRRPDWRRDVPFGEDFETFLVTYNFLNVFGKPLALAPFTLDDYEHALRHSLSDPACVLIGEAHMALLALIARDTTPFRHSALVSLRKEEDTEELIDAMGDVGEGWDKFKMGWEEVVIGCLKDHATVDTLPRLQAILSHLLLESEDELASSDSSELSTPSSSPHTRYPSMPVSDKLALLQYLSDLAVPTKTIKQFLEQGDGQLTELRKEKIELNKEKRRLEEERASMDKEEESTPAEPATGAESPAKSSKKGKSKAAKPVTPQITIDGEDVDMDAAIDATSSKSKKKSKVTVKPVTPEPANSDVDVDSAIDDKSVPMIDELDIPSEPVSETSTPEPMGPRQTSRQKSLLVLALHRDAETAQRAEERRAARTKTANQRAQQAERRRLEEEIAKLTRRLEAVEREFRKLLGALRQKPLGRDRFYHAVWWFDGMGVANLTGPGGNYLWSTGRLFFQGPNEADRRALDTAEGLERRLEEEECEAGPLEAGEWAFYDTVEDIEEFFAWLNAKGKREHQLKKDSAYWEDYILGGARRRQSDLAAIITRPIDTRRSTRVKAGLNDILREPYMQYTNNKRSHK